MTMISLYNYSDYRIFLKDFNLSQPKNGRGAARRLAAALSIHSTLMSQILSGSRSMTLEQASLAAGFLELNEVEAEYFVLLVELDRAGNLALKKIIDRRLKQIKEQSQNLTHRIKYERSLNEAERSIFYSDWVYAATQQIIALSPSLTVEEIAIRLKTPRRRIKEVLDFLMAAGLVLQTEGVLSIGTKSTHLDKSSPWINSHHRNWRLKALEALNDQSANQFHYSCPLTISKADAEQIRELLIKLLEKVDVIIEPSASEEVYCLNLDWFKITGNS